MDWFSSSETESDDERNLQESSPTVPSQKEQEAMTSNQKQAKDIGGENVQHYLVETPKEIPADGSLSTKKADGNFELKREKYTVTSEEEQKAMTSNQMEIKDISGKNVHHYSVETHKEIVADGSLSTKHAARNFELKREKYTVTSQEEQKAKTNNEKETKDISGKNIHQDRIQNESHALSTKFRRFKLKTEKDTKSSQEEQKAMTSDEKGTKDVCGKNVHHYPDGTEIKSLNFVLVTEKYTDTSQDEQKATTSNQKETKDIGGKHVHYYPDETQNEFPADGPLSTKHADGKFEFKTEKYTDTRQKDMSSKEKATDDIIFNNVHHYQLDEIKQEIRADGSIAITYPDGKFELKTEEYTYTEFKDGSTQVVYVDGKRLFKRPDGCYHVTQLNGIKRIHHPDGTVHIIEPDQKKTVFYPNKVMEIWLDTIMMREYPNGKIEHHYLDGSKLHVHPEQYSLLEDKDHKVLYQSAYLNGKFECCSNRVCLLFLTLRGL